MRIIVMKKNIIALCLVLIMALSLCACGKTAPTEADVVETPAGIDVADIPVSTMTVEEAAANNPAAIKPDSGVYTFESAANGISFDYDSKYVAVMNPIGNAVVYINGEMEVPYCTISIVDAEDAAEYLKNLTASAELELGKSIVKAAGEPEKVPYGDREIYFIYYTYADEEVDSNVVCVFYAEKLAGGQIVCYNSVAPEGETESVDSVLKLAIETFKLGK